VEGKEGVMAKMTNKQKVLRKYPRAVCIRVWYWAVMPNAKKTMARELSQKEAWRAAARNL
jgi:hypothetical protein